MNRAGSKLMMTLCIALIAAVCGAAEPMPEKTDLLVAKTGGYAMYRIPGLVATPRGSLLAYCEARHSGSDWAPIDVVLRRSPDGGRTWEPMRRIAHLGPPVPRNPLVAGKNDKPGTQTVNNPIAIVEPGGVVHFLYCVEYSRCFYMRSDDDGVTFTAPVDITAAFEELRPRYNWKVIATGPGHGITLKSGRLLVATWLSTGEHGHHPSVTSTIYSDDRGRTWHAGEVAVPCTREWVDPNETSQVQLADGRVLLNVRNQSKFNRRILTTSPDGATGWTPPMFHDQLLEPICMASMVRLSEQPESDRNRILFANPDNLDATKREPKPGGGRDRKHLTAKLSYDEGRTWDVAKRIEEGYSGYSDLAVGRDGTIFCLYERIRPQDRGAMTLTLARFSLDWLTDGKDRLPTR